VRASTYCRHHLGVLHGNASARTFTCSVRCQARHVRCARCGCLCEGGHGRRVRDGLCYLAGAPCCWSERHGGAQQLVAYEVDCLACGRISSWLQAAPGRCSQCGSALLQIERTRVVAGLHVLPGGFVRGRSESAPYNWRLGTG